MKTTMTKFYQDRSLDYYIHERDSTQVISTLVGESPMNNQKYY
jgi:hypothetical protein